MQKHMNTAHPIVYLESSQQYMDIYIARFPPFVLSGTVHDYSQSSPLLWVFIVHEYCIQDH